MIYDFAFHNSHKNEYRYPFGAVPVGTKINIKLLTERDMNVVLNIISFTGLESSIGMRYEGQSGNRALYSVEIDTADSTGLINYYFTLEKGDRRFFYGNNDRGLGGSGKVYYSNPTPYQITVYENEYVPDWYKEGIMYQIFVDRFYNGNKNGDIYNIKKNSFIYGNWNDDPMYIKDKDGKIARWDFYGGNLNGIIQKLSYLKELGVTIIYLNPIFESSSCHKYDTADYEKVDRMFGDEEVFTTLCTKAKEYGIRIILDGVFSHTGADSKYFNKLSTYKDIGAYQSKESPYYEWFRFYNHPNEYECWWGIDNQPNVNELNPAYLDYIITGEDSIVAKWIKLGASGWRLDVADELPDKFIKLLKKRIREVNKDAILIGEVWEDASNKISYSEKREYLFGKELDSVTNYPLRNVIIEYVKGNIIARELVDTVMSLYENYPLKSFYSMMNLLGNHDTERILTLVDNDIKVLELALVIQMTLPGVPLIYYGDEAGLTGGKDPSNRKTYPWGLENEEVKSIYKKLIDIRKSNDIFINGNLSFSYEIDNILIYKRSYNGKSILVIINSSNDLKQIYLTDEFNGVFKDMTNYKGNIDTFKTSLIIEAKGYIILEEIIKDTNDN